MTAPEDDPVLTAEHDEEGLLETWALSELVHEADAFFQDLRDSSSRLEAERRRFGRLVFEQAESLRGANKSLSREVEQLTRLQALARFLAAPGPKGPFGEGLAEVCGRALDAVGVGVLRSSDEGWETADLWRVSARNARRAAPEAADAAATTLRPSTRKGTDAWWIPVGGGDPPAAGLVALVRAGRRPAEELGPAYADSVVALLAEGLESHSSREELLTRERLRARILQTVRGGLLKLDAAGRVAFANPAFAEMLAIEVEEIEGKALEEVFASDRHLVEILRSVLAGGSLDETETHVTSCRGRRVSVSIKVSHLAGGVLVLFSDLSRRREVEEEFRKSDRLAALGRLSAGVAHEIRNPLAGIRTTAEILRGRVESSDDLVRFVDVILEESRRLDRIVESLLQFAKPPAPKRTRVRTDELLDRAHRLATGRASERGITIRVSVNRDLPEPLADRDQLLQVLLNVLLNAVEATSEGGEVSATADVQAARAGRELCIVVQDGGPGVPSAIRERIFDPFFTTKPGGTGLGLSISRNILRQHGGTLRMENEPGRGARAIVTLPLNIVGAGTDPGEARWPTS
jgi:PAS domain S-box-containing protein